MESSDGKGWKTSGLVGRLAELKQRLVAPLLRFFDSTPRRVNLYLTRTLIAPGTIIWGIPPARADCNLDAMAERAAAHCGASGCSLLLIEVDALRECPQRDAYHVGNQIRAIERSAKYKLAKSS